MEGCLQTLEGLDKHKQLNHQVDSFLGLPHNRFGAAHNPHTAHSPAGSLDTNDHPTAERFQLAVGHLDRDPNSVLRRTIILE